MDALTREPDARGPAIVRPRSRLGRAIMVLLCLLVMGGIVYLVWFWPGRAGDSGHARTGGGPVPVVVATAMRRDVPIYLDGLGTVQAFNTVTIKPMVDGPLTSVNFTEGQAVKAGDVLATIDARSYQAALDQAVAKKQQDAAQLANARIDLGRYQKLIAQSSTTAQLADTQKAVVAQDEAQVAQDQAQIESAHTQLSYTTITAPLDGLTGMRQVDAGNIVHATDTTGLVMITQMHPISVVFTLPQQALPAVARAMKAGMPEVLAYAQGASPTPSGLLDRGKLAVLDNQVDPTTGTIKLKATFANPDDKLWPGGFVGVRLLVDVVKDATVVPTAAVQRGPRGTYAYVITGNDAVSRRLVTVGHEDETASVITGGIKPDDRVVTEGAARLTDGSHVTIAEAAAGAGTDASGVTPAAAPGAAQPAAHRSSD